MAAHMRIFLRKPSGAIDWLMANLPPSLRIRPNDAICTRRSRSRQPTLSSLRQDKSDAMGTSSPHQGKPQMRRLHWPRAESPDGRSESTRSAIIPLATTCRLEDQDDEHHTIQLRVLQYVGNKRSGKTRRRLPDTSPIGAYRDTETELQFRSRPPMISEDLHQRSRRPG